mgnify:CR=1 FL=1|jgi:NAD-dependent dihydropyrimidine dehydrogenase PreA subunit
MRVNVENCVGCKACVPYCPVHAITVEDSVAIVDLDICTECNNCYRSGACKFNALEKENDIKWPRTIRPLLSDVFTEYKGVAGRGTEEMKTNDVTERFKIGYTGIAIELGRPLVGTSFRDVERMAKLVAKHGAIFESKNPVTSYIADKTTGEMQKDILDERAISAIIEVLIKNEDLENIINDIIDEGSKLDTVFSLDVVCAVEPDNTIAAQKVLDKMKIKYRPNCKTNVGLGRRTNKI